MDGWMVMWELCTPADWILIYTHSFLRLQDLANRFEAPIEKNRWDSPLFRLGPGSAALPRSNPIFDLLAQFALYHR